MPRLGSDNPSRVAAIESWYRRVAPGVTGSTPAGDIAASLLGATIPASTTATRSTRPVDEARRRRTESLIAEAYAALGKPRPVPTVGRGGSEPPDWVRAVDDFGPLVLGPGGEVFRDREAATAHLGDGWRRSIVRAATAAEVRGDADLARRARYERAAYSALGIETLPSARSTGSVPSAGAPPPRPWTVLLSLACRMLIGAGDDDAAAIARVVRWDHDVGGPISRNRPEVMKARQVLDQPVDRGAARGDRSDASQVWAGFVKQQRRAMPAVWRTLAAGAEVAPTAPG